MVYSRIPMHIPDGFISPLISVICWIIAIITITVSLRKNMNPNLFPITGVLSSTIFAGQMLNFPITSGTSGHLLGAALSAILLGPRMAMIIMTSIVVIQAIVFQDGGILALGTNLVNMAIIATFVAYSVYKVTFLVTNKYTNATTAQLIAGFVAAWFSVMASALACAFEIILSGNAPASLVIPAMAGTHALIGLGEGLLTVDALRFIAIARPDILNTEQTDNVPQRIFWFSGVLLTVTLILLSPFASSYPDGLEWTAEKLGFVNKAQALWNGLMPDYIIPGFEHESYSTIFAGFIGALLTFTLIAIIYRKHKV